MQIILTLTEANPGIELGTSDLSSAKDDDYATTSAHNIIWKRHISYANGSHPGSFTIILNTPRPSNVMWRRDNREVPHDICD